MPARHSRMVLVRCTLPPVLSVVTSAKSPSSHVQWKRVVAPFSVTTVSLHLAVNRSRHSPTYNEGRSRTASEVQHNPPQGGLFVSQKRQLYDKSMKLLSLLAATAILCTACAPAAAPDTNENEASSASSMAMNDAMMDASVETEEVSYGAATGYLAKPEGDGPFPAIVLIHEWWGLNENIEWYAEQFAAQGYVALAVNMYGEEATEEPERARELATSVRNDIDGAFTNLESAVAYLKSRDDVDSARLASVGWCFGGQWSYEMAKNDMGVNASVMYYGQFAPEDDLEMMKALIQGHFGEDDQSIPVDDVRTFQARLQTLSGEHEVYIYPNQGHGFARELESDEARQAWQRTLEFLEEHI